jgi:hypothetical protein
MKKKNYILKAISILMTLVIFALTLLPSQEVIAYSGRDKNGNLSVTATGTIKINLLVAAIDPTLTSTDGKNYWNGKTKIKASEYFGYSLDESLNFWIDNFEEISHNTVDFNVVDTVIIDEFPKYKSIDSLKNSSFQKIFKKDESGHGLWYDGVTSNAYKKYDTCGDLNYDYYIDKLDLVKRKNNNEFDMLFLIGIDPLSPFETCMVGRDPLYINGGTFERDCDNFIIVTPTFSRKDGSIENIGHMAENMLGYTYGRIDYIPNCIDGSNYAALNDWQKFCLCKFTATPDTKVYGYGMVHFSPNSTADYDWNNYTKVDYYKDWKNGSNKQKFTADEYMNTNSVFYYEGDPCISHHRWWFYNMPYQDGRDKDGYYNNWWRYIFTPSYVDYIYQDDSYILTQGIVLNVGESTAVKFGVMEQPWYGFSTDTVASSAPVEIEDKSVLSFSNGKITGLKTGKTKITVKLDGKSVEYTVYVGDKAGQLANITAFVKRMYWTTLSRDPDEDGLNYWVNNLYEGNLTGAQTAKHFILSKEFKDKNLTYNEFLDVMYASFFNRYGDEGGYNFWLDQMYNGATQEYVVACFVDSDEFTEICNSYGIVRGNLDKGKGAPTSTNGITPMKVDSSKVNDAQLLGYVEKLYTTILGRDSEPDGCEYWKQAIKEGNGMDAGKAASCFFQSKEYKDKNKTDEEFLVDVYMMFFGREPDQGGFDYWLDNLKNERVSRVWLIEKGFGQSDEFKGILKSYGFVIIN